MPSSAPELTQLRDIHLPNPIGWWPLAPGWYLVAMLVCLTLLAITVVTIRTIRNGRSKRQALRFLKSYEIDYLKHHNSQLSSARVSELLKRVALIYFPRERVASLQGAAWVDFLTQTGNQLDFRAIGDLLIECPYQPSTQHDLMPLFCLAKSWIKQRRGRCLN